MPNDNTRLVRQLYDAFAQGDAASVLGGLHDDVEWNEAEGNPYADGNPYRGPQRVGEGVFGRTMGDWDDFTVSPRHYVTEDEDVVVMGRYTATRKGSGASLDAQFVHHWTFEDGKVRSFQQYMDTAQMRDLLE